ncbi:MAG: hypothetical protein KUG58_06215, partial [Marinosulfonomonas sp.]|nr:hypothetical protein [Marinosulfonomonas sp.]
VPEGLGDWGKDWRRRRDLEMRDPFETMRHSNPAYIARNHRIEAAISAGVAGDFEPFHTLNTVLGSPYQDQPEHAAFRTPPTADEVVKQTFCGT